jgi:DNA-binding NtrC family response regulator
MDKVLIVDDDVDCAESLKLMLDSQNYSSVTAHSEKEALESIRRDNVVLALLDVKLGKDSGIRLLNKINKVRPGILCIMITGYGSVDTAIQSIKGGACDYLRKPVKPEELFASIKKGRALDSAPPNNGSANGVHPFLNEAASTIDRHFSKYTGSVTLHIRDGKLASWESKTGGRYND